jgi:predicted ATPase
LTHDVAYAGLLGERRRALHGAVVIAIERLHAGRLAEHVERLAHHARQGEVWDKAVSYLRQAGAKVLLRSANRDAVTFFEQALEALRRLPEHPDRIADSLDILFELRNPLNLLGEGARVRALLDETETLAEAAGDQRRLGRALTYKVMQSGFDGDIAGALRIAHRALSPSARHRRTCPSRLSRTAIWGERTSRSASAARPSGIAEPRWR